MIHVSPESTLDDLIDHGIELHVAALLPILGAGQVAVPLHRLSPAMGALARILGLRPAQGPSSVPAARAPSSAHGR